MRTPLVLLALALCGALLNAPWPVSVRGADAPVGTFSGVRAMAPLAEWAAAPRPAGSEAAARVRRSVAQALEATGFTVRDEASRGGRLHNLVADAPGAGPGGVWLVAHSDSVPGAPGAADDGLGLAVVTEAARVLSEGGVPPGLHVLVTDGEELGLYGAADHVAALDDEGRAARRLVLNVEARGTEGPAYMFQTAGPEGPILAAWRQSGCRAQATSLARFVYANLPNDTDFTVFRAAGWWGYDFALIHGAWRYHTAEDTVANLSPASVQAVGDCVVGLARAWLAAPAGLDGPGEEVAAERRVYAQLAGRTVEAAPWVVRALALGALVAHGRPRRVLPGVGAWLLAAFLAVLAGFGLLFGALTFWPDFAVPPAEAPHPEPLFVLAGLAGLGAGVLAARWTRRFGVQSGWFAAATLGAAGAALAVPAAGYAFLPAAWGAALRARGAERAAAAVALLAGAVFGPVILGAYLGLTTRLMPALVLLPLLGFGWMLVPRAGGPER